MPRIERRIPLFDAIFIFFFASQVYWIIRAFIALWHRVRRGAVLTALTAALVTVYLTLAAATFDWFGNRPTPVRMTAYDALLIAPFLWWAVSSMLAFAIVLVLWVPRTIWRAVARMVEPRMHGKDAAPEIESPSRRLLFRRTAAAAVAAPFVGGAYGLLYGRLNLQTTRTRIRLPRLPKAVDGFRIAQLSDIHIGPFMTADEIRKYVRITNNLKPELIVLTGDFITWDPATQQPVVDALSDLRAPFGVVACLGNHEAWSGTEDSISLLLRQAGIPVLRHARMPVAIGREELNLIGIDYTGGHHGRSGRSAPPGRRIEDLIARERINILLSHNPNTFDRAAALGVDLTLSGHTHGGQVTLEFVDPRIAPSRLITPYVAGWFAKPGAQLYVNRGIGTMFVPIRFGAPPEIAIIELARTA